MRKTLYQAKDLSLPSPLGSIYGTLIRVDAQPVPGGLPDTTGFMSSESEWVSY